MQFSNNCVIIGNIRRYRALPIKEITAEQATLISEENFGCSKFLIDKIIEYNNAKIEEAALLGGDTIRLNIKDPSDELGKDVYEHIMLNMRNYNAITRTLIDYYRDKGFTVPNIGSRRYLYSCDWGHPCIITWRKENKQ